MSLMFSEGQPEPQPPDWLTPLLGVLLSSTQCDDGPEASKVAYSTSVRSLRFLLKIGSIIY